MRTNSVRTPRNVRYESNGAPVIPRQFADAALDYVCGHDGVWLATGGEIIDHYLSSGATF